MGLQCTSPEISDWFVPVEGSSRARQHVRKRPMQAAKLSEGGGSSQVPPEVVGVAVWVVTGGLSSNGCLIFGYICCNGNNISKSLSKFHSLNYYLKRFLHKNRFLYVFTL